MVQDNYDAGGNILSVEDNSTDLIGSINPFRYKGYYYDVETHSSWICKKIFSIEEVESYDDLGNRIKKARNYIV